MTLENMAMGVNYGSDRVRFPAPVKVGARVRGRGEVLSAQMFGAAVQLVVRISVEIEGSERPGCVVDTISRYTFNPTAE
ncbi:putative enoyl-CoA hydratase 1 [compost metagenome]